ncbi:hypothetical protein [Paenibacillus sp. TH7-28]
MAKVLEKCSSFDRTVNPELYITSMNNDELITIVNGLEDFEEVSFALTELSIRDTKIVSLYCWEIMYHCIVGE